MRKHVKPSIIYPSEFLPYSPHGETYLIMINIVHLNDWSREKHRDSREHKTASRRTSHKVFCYTAIIKMDKTISERKKNTPKVFNECTQRTYEFELKTTFFNNYNNNNNNNLAQFPWNMLLKWNDLFLYRKHQLKIRIQEYYYAKTNIYKFTYGLVRACYIGI